MCINSMKKHCQGKANTATLILLAIFLIPFSSAAANVATVSISTDSGRTEYSIDPGETINISYEVKNLSASQISVSTQLYELKQGQKQNLLESQSFDISIGGTFSNESPVSTNSKEPGAYTYSIVIKSITSDGVAVTYENVTADNTANVYVVLTKRNFQIPDSNIATAALAAVSVLLIAGFYSRKRRKSQDFH